MIEAYYLSCINEPLAIGWVHNASYYWYNYKEVLLTNCYSGAFNDLLSGLLANQEFLLVDDENEYPFPLYNEEIQISDLWANTFYDVQFYDTRTGDYITNLNQTVMADQFGKVNILIPYLDDGNPDLAFMMTYHSLKSNLLGSEENTRQSNIETKGYFTLFPNPSSTGIYYIKSGYEVTFVLSVYDVKGSNIYNSKAEKGVNLIDLSDNPPGLYYLTLRDHEQFQTFKIIKN